MFCLFDFCSCEIRFRFSTEFEDVMMMMMTVMMMMMMMMMMILMMMMMIVTIASARLGGTCTAPGEVIKKPPRRQGRSGSKVLHRLRRARRRRSERLDGRDLHGGASASKHWGHR